MKVVVTAQGSNLDSPVDPRFGRARYFLLVDTDTGEFTTHDNVQNLNAAQGAGIQAAQTVVGRVVFFCNYTQTCPVLWTLSSVFPGKEIAFHFACDRITQAKGMRSEKSIEL